MKKLWSLLALLAGFCGFADVTLVRDGVPVSVIVLEKHATKSAQLGAAELRHHVKRITGAELPVVTEADPSKVNLFIGGHNQGMKQESSRMLFKGGDIYLTGNDTADFGKVDYRDPKTFPPFEFHYKGSLWAVYDFLERCCDVRFYWLDESGTTYEPRKTLTVKEENREYTPQLDAFREIYYYGGEPKVSPRDEALWKLRWRMSCYFGRTNHNMYSLYFYHYKPAKTKFLAPVFLDSRPEYFAQGYKGEGGGDWLLMRNYPEDRDLPPQLCYTHPGVSAWYAEEVLTYAGGKNRKGGYGNKAGTLSADVTTLPRMEGKPFYYPIEGGDNGSFCRCRNCQALIRPDNISDLKFTLMSEIARKTAVKDPNAGVSTLAYIQSLYYPQAVSLPENLSVQLCLTVYAWWHPTAYRLQHGEYKKWIRNEAKKRPLTLWTYLFSTYWDSKHFGLYKPFPGLYPWKTGELFKEFTADGIRGWFTEVQMQYNALEAYVAARICFDPSTDPEALIEEYFRKSFGKAGPAVKAFYREIESAYWNPANCPEEWLKNPEEFVGPSGRKHPFWGTGLHSPEVNWALGTDARMAKLSALIAEARKMVATPQEKLRLQRMIDTIWTPALKGREEFLELQKIPKKKTTVLLPVIPEAGGDLRKVDWSKSSESEDFTDAFGREIPKKCTIRMAMDSRYLYLKFHEKAAPTPGKMLWRENLELFFSKAKSYPVYHMGISPFGEKAEYVHQLVNDTPRLKEYDFQMKRISTTAKDSWDLMLAIPLERLPFDGETMSVNFFRTWGAHGEFGVWAPINVSHYLGGLQRFGILKRK